MQVKRLPVILASQGELAASPLTVWLRNEDLRECTTVLEGHSEEIVGVSCSNNNQLVFASPHHRDGGCFACLRLCT